MSPVNKIQHALVTSGRRPGEQGDLGGLRIALCAVFAAHGPPAIGFLASQAGLRTGLTTLSFLGLAAALIAWLSRDPPELSGSASPHPGS